MTHKIVVIFFLLSVRMGCVLAQSEYSIERNIPYREEGFYKENSVTQRCRLDIYFPTQAKKFATLIWFHGGGLTSGEKQIPEELKGQGFAIVGVGYRLSPSVQTKEILLDATAAVAWVFNNIEKFGGDRTKIFVAGHSAGGYLTSMVGLNKSLLAQYNIDANLLAGLIPFSGHTITHFTTRKEMGIEETKPIIDEMAPLFYIRMDAPPLILITGDRELELLGRYEENAYMYRMMKVVGHKQTFIHELKGYNHDMAKGGYPILLEFIKNYNKKN